MADDLILTARIFAAKHSGMGHRKDRWWQSVPWGWVLVSAYCTALVCVAVSQVTAPGDVAMVVKEYQTLIAGLATVAALLIAAQQLKRQAKRDAVDANRHHQAEIDALAELDRAAMGLAARSSRSYQSEIMFERPRWERLSHGVHISLTPAISEVMKSVEAHNRLLNDTDMPFMALHRPDERQISEASRALLYACHYLSAAIAKRRGDVRGQIEAAS